MDSSVWELWQRLFMGASGAAGAVRSQFLRYTRMLGRLTLVVCAAWLGGLLLLAALAFFNAPAILYLLLWPGLAALSLAWLLFALPVLLPTAFLLEAVPEIRQTMHGLARVIAAIALGTLMPGWLCLMPFVREHPRVLVLFPLLLVILGLGTYLGLMHLSHRAVRAVFAVHVFLPLGVLLLIRLLPEASAALEQRAASLDWALAESLSDDVELEVACDRPLEAFTPAGKPRLYWLRRGNGDLAIFQSDGVDTLTGARRALIDTPEEVAMLRDHERAICEAEAREREEAMRRAAEEAERRAEEAERIQQAERDRALLEAEEMERKRAEAWARAEAEAPRRWQSSGTLPQPSSREPRMAETSRSSAPEKVEPQRTPQHGPPPRRRIDGRAPLPPYPALHHRGR